MRLPRLLALSALALCLASCAPRQDTAQATGAAAEVLTVRDADPRLLGERMDVPGLGVSFQPPMGWRAQKGEKLVPAAAGSFTKTPTALFFRDDGTGFCTISRVSGTANRPGEDPLLSYAQVLVGTLQKTGTLSYKNLRINGMPGILLRVVGQKEIVFIFIVTGETSLLQVDFVFPTDEFSDSLTPRMKAAVASLRGR